MPVASQTFWTRTLGFGQPNLVYCLCEGQVDRKISLLPEGDF